MYRMRSSKSKNWVDTHFHVFHAGEAVRGARYVPSYSALLTDWMRQAQAVGVGQGVWIQPSFLGTDNRLMVSALQAHPERLRGVAVVSPDVPPDELKALHAAGVRGLRLNLAGTSHDLAEWAQAHAIWEAMHRIGWHLEVHTDQGQLPQVLAQLPSGLPLVVDHMAKPWQASAHDDTLVALRRRAQVSPVYVKLSGAYRLGQVNPDQLAALWFEELGPEALLWGSDWPCTNHEQWADFEQLMEQAHRWIRPEWLAHIMVRNPMKLYWGEA